MNPEGKIELRLVWDGRFIRHVRLTSRHLPPIGPLLRGRSTDEAAAIVPMLFSLCRKAQGAAATAALAAAQQREPDNLLWLERDVCSEALLELLWRFLLDLPELLGEHADPAIFGRLHRELTSAAREREEKKWLALICDVEAASLCCLFGSAATLLSDAESLAGLVRNLAQANTATARLLLECWRGGARWGGGEVKLMPPGSRENILADLAPALDSDDEFNRYPHWNGCLVETGPLARMQHHSLLTDLVAKERTSIMARLLARLLEIGDLFTRLRAPLAAGSKWVQYAAVRPGLGLAWVQTARGLLLHRAQLNARGEVESYSIVAPTEWNFHPAGPCVIGLDGKAATSETEVRDYCGLIVHALDPCVAYQIKVDHA